MNEYRDIEASLLRFTSDFAVDCTNFGMEIEPILVDGFANPEAWPEKDFIGPSEMQIDFTDGRIYVTLAMVISTRSDINLTKMGQITNRLINKLAKDTKILIYDAVAGTPRGHLIVADGLRAGATIQTKSQPARPVMINLISDQMLTRG